MELDRASWVDPRYDRVESYPSIDANHLRSVGALFPGLDPDGEDGWASAATTLADVSVRYDGESSTAFVICEGSSTPVRVEWRRCGFGGVRPWFRCPRCGSRRGKLLLAAGIWACRECHGLRCESQRLAPFDRRALKARRLRQRLGQSGGWLCDELPDRPRFMKARKYLKLMQRIGDADHAAIRSIGH